MIYIICKNLGIILFVLFLDPKLLYSYKTYVFFLIVCGSYVYSIHFLKFLLLLNVIYQLIIMEFTTDYSIPISDFI